MRMLPSVGLIALLWVAACGGGEQARIAGVGAKTSPTLYLSAVSAGDTVWVKTTYGLTGSFAATDTVVIDYYRPASASDTGTAVVVHKTRATTDSAAIPTLVAAGGIQTFSVCAKVRSAAGLFGAARCSAPVSWTRPSATVPPVVPGTPTVTVTVHTTATQLWTIGSFTYTGIVTSVNTSAGLNAGGTGQTHALTGAVATDSFAFPLPVPGSGTTTGFLGSKACNTAGCSVTQFGGWSYTAKPDTTTTPAATVVGVIVWPDSVIVAAKHIPRSFDYKVVNGKTVAYADTGGKVQFCAFTKMSNGQIWPSSNTKGIVRCDSVGAKMANYNPNAATKLAPSQILKYALAKMGQ